MSLVFYARVSSEEQNLDRQLARAKEVHTDKIFSEKYSGKNFNRPAFKEMMNYLREDDILQVVSLDRHYNDIKKLIQRLRDIGVTLIVDDLPQTNTGNPLVDQFMMDMMIQLMGFVAQNEREKIRERQAQGIKIAKAAHVYTGRKIKYGKNAKDPRNRWVWQTVVEDLKKENVPIASIAKKVGISRQQVYRIKKRENI